MAETSASQSDPIAKRHVTLRPGFVFLIGLFVLTLYFVWAFYDAAPTSLAFVSEEGGEEPAVTPMAGMDVNIGEMDATQLAGHGAGAGAMTPEEFEEITYRFADDLTLEDGSVRPTREWMEALEAESSGMEGMESEEGEAAAGHAEEEEDGPIDVYMMAQRFSYVPSVLRLKAGQTYRFWMMSTDVNHGASIHTGFAAHVMRRPAKMLTEMEMTFPRPGEYMVYCTVYCGLGHDQMKGKIIVEPQ